MKNLELGTTYDDRDELAIRLSVDWELSDTMLLKFTTQHQSSDDNRPRTTIIL